jgi:hypothetical protein
MPEWTRSPRQGAPDDKAGLARIDRQSLRGKGAFRRFRDVLYERHPELISVWQVLRDARGRARAVQWLADAGLIDEDAARGFARDHPEPGLP